MVMIVLIMIMIMIIVAHASRSSPQRVKCSWIYNFLLRLMWNLYQLWNTNLKLLYPIITIISMSNNLFIFYKQWQQYISKINLSFFLSRLNSTFVCGKK